MGRIIVNATRSSKREKKIMHWEYLLFESVLLTFFDLEITDLLELCKVSLTVVSEVILDDLERVVTMALKRWEISK